MRDITEIYGVLKSRNLRIVYGLACRIIIWRMYIYINQENCKNILATLTFNNYIKY